MRSEVGTTNFRFVISNNAKNRFQVKCQQLEGMENWPQNSTKICWYITFTKAINEGKEFCVISSIAWSSSVIKCICWRVSTCGVDIVRWQVMLLDLDSSLIQLNAYPDQFTHSTTKSPCDAFRLTNERNMCCSYQKYGSSNCCSSSLSAHWLIGFVFFSRSCFFMVTCVFFVPIVRCVWRRRRRRRRAYTFAPITMMSPIKTQYKLTSQNVLRELYVGVQWMN